MNLLQTCYCGGGLICQMLVAARLGDCEASSNALYPAVMAELVPGELSTMHHKRVTLLTGRFGMQ
jgi:hypothetical protein